MVQVARGLPVPPAVPAPRICTRDPVVVPPWYRLLCHSFLQTPGEVSRLLGDLGAKAAGRPPAICDARFLPQAKRALLASIAFAQLAREIGLRHLASGASKCSRKRRSGAKIVGLGWRMLAAVSNQPRRFSGTPCQECPNPRRIRAYPRTSESAGSAERVSEVAANQRFSIHRSALASLIVVQAVAGSSPVVHPS